MTTHSTYFWWTPLPEKQEIPQKTWWWCHHHVFHVFFLFGVAVSVKSMQCGYSLDAEFFWGSGVRQKYAVWVLVGCGIKFRIQRALPIEIWVKTQWDMSKIRTKKVVFFNDEYANSTIMVDLFYWNSIGSWIPTHKNLFWQVFL